MAARPTWQGHLRLSLVTCPVALYKATEARTGVSFNLINPRTKSRVKQVMTDASKPPAPVSLRHVLGHLVPDLVLGAMADALPGQVFPGRVRRIAPYVTEVEKQARTVDVEVDFAEPERQPLLVGYSADAEVVVDRRDDALRLPTQAIRQDGSVLVLGADGVLTARTPKTGLANWAYTEVLDGLAAGDRVVTAFDSEAVVPGARAVAKPARP